MAMDSLRDGFRRRLGVLSIALAVAGGVACAWWVAPRWLELRALRAIAGPDPDRRAEAWRRLAPPGGPPPGSRLVVRINRALGGAALVALADAGDALRPHGRWGWAHQPPGLVLRELRWRAVLDDRAEQDLAVTALADAPLELDGAPLAAIVDALLASPDGEVRRGAYDAACLWAGLERPDWLRGLALPAPDPLLRRRAALAGVFVGSDPDWFEQPEETLAEVPLDVLEARLLAAAAREPDGADLVERLLRRDWDGRAPAFAYVLRIAADSRAASLLARMADGGDRAALSALQARDREREDAAARPLALDPARPPWLRRLAAWRWSDAGPEMVREILAGPVVEPDGSAYAAALLAERRLPPGDAAALAESWIRDFDDDRKRAGALLAALLGAHADLLEDAYRIEDVGAVRTTQRLALHALGRRAGPEDPREFAHRALHAGEGEVRPDALLCLLAAGAGEATAHLATTPGGDDPRAATQARAWLIERFVPQWHRALGRPLGGDERALRLHFDALHVLAKLTGRRLVFDEGQRVFRYEE